MKRRRVFAYTLLLVGVVALPVSAQESAPQPAGNGFLFEEIKSGFVVAPDYKFTELDGKQAGLLGVRGGFVTDRRFLVGGAAYWRPRSSDGLEMLYGGGLVEWFANPGGVVDFSVSGLAGLGTATLTDGASWLRLPWHSFGRHGGRFPSWSHWRGHGHGWFRYRQEFFVAEPQASVHLNLADWIRVGGGAGYRLIGAAGPDNDRLRGFTASIGVQIGPL